MKFLILGLLIAAPIAAHSSEIRLVTRYTYMSSDTGREIEAYKIVGVVDKISFKTRLILKLSIKGCIPDPQEATSSLEVSELPPGQLQPKCSRYIIFIHNSAANRFKEKISKATQDVQLYSDFWDKRISCGLLIWNCRPDGREENDTRQYYGYVIPSRFVNTYIGGVFSKSDDVWFD